MPRTGSANVVHISITDHRIVRRAKDAAVKPGAEPRFGESALAAFHRKRKADDPDAQRDLGIALAGVALAAGNRDLALQAFRRLRDATERDARDLEAWQAYAHTLMLLREPEQALETAEAVLAWAPKHEASLYQAASLAMMPGTLDRAVDYWQRLIALHPRGVGNYIGLTNSHALRGDWERAAAAAEQAVRLNPTEAGPRISWIQALLRAGLRERAEHEFAVLEKMQPANLDQVRGWFTMK
jgi:tetratricopeptide (TPR) repeat protein